MANKEHKLRKCKEWKIANSDRQKDRQLKRLYGLTLEDLNTLMSKQLGLCKLCGLYMPKPVIDHDHKTGRVRGLVHQRCNILIGMYQTIVEDGLVDTIVSYLKEP